MKDRKEFYTLLESVSGRRYHEYRELVGDFDFARYVLKVNHIEEEGTPSMVVVRVPQVIAAFPPHLFNSPVRRTALEDLLTRELAEQIELLATFNDGGLARRHLGVASPEQQILPRTALVVTEEYVEARVYVDLGTVNGRIPEQVNHDIFFDQLPQVVNGSLIYCNLDEGLVERATDVMEDADQLRQMLTTRGLVGFAAAGSVLEREVGTDLPSLDGARLDVPAQGTTDVDVPNARNLSGIGIPTGLTLVIGDAYSGRVELLDSLSHGIYNHTPGDGREFVVSVPDAVRIVADPGRPVQRVDISPFVSGEHGGERYATDFAESVASQASSLMEAIEAGARVLLFDEADSAIGFLGGDDRVAALTGSTSSITPLAARVRELVDELGLSLVVGADASAASFIPVADTILKMENHTVTDITQDAKELGLAAPAPAEPGLLTKVVEKARWIVPTSIDPSLGTSDASVEALDMSSLVFGRHYIDLENVMQLSDIHQTRTIGYILAYAKGRYLDEGRPVRELLDLIDRDLSSEGLECLTRELNGELARPRRYEVAAALNRLATLRVSHTSA